MGMIERKKRLLMIRKSRIPFEYQEVEWVLGNNCRIDLNYVPKVSPKAIAKMAINALGDRDVMGFPDNTYPSFIINPSCSNNFQTAIWFNRYGSTSAYSFYYLPHQDVPNLYEFGREVYVNGERKAQLDEADWSQNVKSFQVFAGRSAHIGVTFYDFKLYDGDAIVRNLVPCYRKADSVIGMYDLITSTFFTSISGGTFTKGPDV